MKKFLSTGLLTLVPWLSWGQHIALPDLYDVQGVQAGEQLNIREEPNSRSSVLSRLAHDVKDIEVVAIDDNWAQVNINEASGWVALNYLQAQPSVWQNGQLPDGLSCFGTEPFWNASFSENEVRLTAPEQPEQRFAIQSVSDRGFPEDRLRAIEARELTAVLVPKACSDGMSDRIYALEAVVLFRDKQQPMLSGCCSIAKAISATDAIVNVPQ